MSQAEPVADASGHLAPPPSASSKSSSTREGQAPHAVRRGRPEAAAAIWSWRESGATAAGPNTGAARLRGVLKALLPAVIGVVIYRHVSTLGGSIVLTISGLILIAALLSPTGLYAVIERGFDALTAQVGRLLNWIVLPVLFYCVFLPFGKVLRAGKRDRLQRFSDTTRSSYWSDRTGERSASSKRERQY